MNAEIMPSPLCPSSPAAVGRAGPKVIRTGEPTIVLGRIGPVPPLGSTIVLALVAEVQVSFPGGPKNRRPCQPWHLVS